MAGVSITITIFYEYIFMNILASFRRRHPPAAHTHTHRHLVECCFLTANRWPDKSEAIFAVHLLGRCSGLQTPRSSMLDNNRKWRDSTQTLEASHLAARYVPRIQMSLSPLGGVRFFFFFLVSVCVCTCLCVCFSSVTKKLLSRLCRKENGDFVREADGVFSPVNTEKLRTMCLGGDTKFAV